MADSSLMTRAEFRRVRRLLLSVAGAWAISMAGIALAIFNSSFAVGWLLVPGGMLVLMNMPVHDDPALWIYIGMILNVSLWTLVIYIVTALVRNLRRRAAA